MTDFEGTMSGYVIRGGQEGKRRLETLSRVLWPTTFQLLKAHVRAGMSCLDLGCGGGDVTVGMARLAGSAGRVVGIDMDSVKLAAAQTEAARLGLGNIEFRDSNVLMWSEDGVYDLAYARFLLTHLPDPGATLVQMRHALRPGGILVVEDIDFAGSFSHPKSAAFERYVELYREVVRRRGGDADIGPKLHQLLFQAGLQCVKLHLAQPIHVDQEGKEIALITLINIADAVLAEGLTTEADLTSTVAELGELTHNPLSVVSLPRIFQAWGFRP